MLARTRASASFQLQVVTTRLIEAGGLDAGWLARAAANEGMGGGVAGVGIQAFGQSRERCLKTAPRLRGLVKSHERGDYHCRMPTLPLTLIVITHNESANIARCLDSVPFATEKIVVDSGSEDDTVAIARAHGARVVHQDWLGF